MRADTLRPADADAFFTQGYEEMGASYRRKTVMRWVHLAKLRNEELLRFSVSKNDYLLVLDTDGEGQWKVVETMKEAEFTACVESLGLRLDTDFLHFEWKWWHVLGLRPAPLKVYDVSGWDIQGPPEPENDKGPGDRPFLRG